MDKEMFNNGAIKEVLRIAEEVYSGGTVDPENPNTLFDWEKADYSDQKNNPIKQVNSIRLTYEGLFFGWLTAGQHEGNQLWVKLYLNFEIALEQWLDETRWRILDALEKILWWFYQDGQNNDPCSFEYIIDSHHCDESQLEFTVICIDYLS